MNRKEKTLSWHKVLGALLLLFSFCGTLRAQDLPLMGLSHVGIAVSDIDRGKQFYNGVLGIDMAFTLVWPDTKALWLQYYKMNENDYIEIYPTLKPGAINRETHIAFQTDDLVKLHQMMEARGLKPQPLGKIGPDGNWGFNLLTDPGQGVPLEFVQYMPGSLHINSRGKSLSERRISTHMIGVGVLISDPAAAESLYKTLGFKEVWRGTDEDGKVRLIDLQLPGGSGDYVELVERTLPVTAEQAGRAGHIALEVSDIQAAYKKAKARNANIVNTPALNGRKVINFNILDPDNTTIMFQQAAHR